MGAATKKPVSSKQKKSDEMRRFMEADVGMGVKNISPLHAAWAGNGEADDAELDRLEAKNRSPRTALLALVRRIVESHSTDRKGNNQRIEDVLFLLLENRKSVRKSKGGRPIEYGDEEILIEIGREYFLDSMAPESDPRQFTKLYRAAAARVPREAAFLKLDEHQRDARLRTLRRKFESQKNEILLKIAPADAQEYNRFVKAINSAMTALTQLGLGAHDPNKVLIEVYL